MPSIPQSLLWISLVVLWLFVLVPMLISKREAVRRTSDVALATRVLNGRASARLLKRSGPAAGHRSDPDWKPEEEEWADEAVDGVYADADLDQIEDPHADTDQDENADPPQDADDARPVAMGMAAASEAFDAQAGDVDVVVVGADSDALPVGGAEPSLLTVEDDAVGTDSSADGGARAAGSVTEECTDQGVGRSDRGGHADEYEYVEDSSGLEPDDEADDVPAAVAPVGSRQHRRFVTNTAAAVSARKYAFRKRALMTMAVVLVGSATLAFQVTPSAWWVCGGATAITVLYLGYLRRQTRIEDKVRRRRMQRLARSRLGVENTRDRDYDVVPARLRRPGAVVLEIDDEDPIFVHLDSPMQNYSWPRNLPRAVGQ